MEQLTGGVVSDELAALSAAVEGFLASLSDRLARALDADVIAELHEVERLRRQLASADHDLIGVVNERSLPARVSVASTQVFLQGALRLSPGEAATRVRAAELVGEGRTVSGDPP